VRVAAVRRTALTAAAVSVVLLATACGGGEPGSGDKAAGGAKADKPAAKALTGDQLETLVVAQGDVGKQEVKKPEDAFQPDDLSVDEAECEPVAQALSALPPGKPVADAQRVVVDESETAKKGMPSLDELADMSEEEAKQATLDSMDITKTFTSLWSYDGDGAQRGLDSLRKAAKRCADGFGMTIDGEKQQVTGVTVEKLSAGQDAVAWTVGTKQDGTAARTKVVVFRHGTTLAAFSSFNIAAVARGEDFPMPTKVIEAQEAKLG
jgi:hypothetical protein